MTFSRIRNYRYENFFLLISFFGVKGKVFEVKGQYVYNR